MTERLPEHPFDVALAGLVAQAAAETRSVAEWLAVLRDPDEWDTRSPELQRWGDRLIREAKAADLQPEALTRLVLDVCDRIERRAADHAARLAAIPPAGRA